MANLRALRAPCQTARFWYYRYLTAA